MLLSLEVKNVGSDPGENINITVTTTDDYVTMTNTQANYGTVPAGGTKIMDDAFAFDVTGDIPDLHTVIFAHAFHFHSHLDLAANISKQQEHIQGCKVLF